MFILLYLKFYVHFMREIVDLKGARFLPLLVRVLSSWSYGDPALGENLLFSETVSKNPIYSSLMFLSIWFPMD